MVVFGWGKLHIVDTNITPHRIRTFKIPDTNKDKCRWLKVGSPRYNMVMKKFREMSTKVDRQLELEIPIQTPRSYF